MHQAATYKDLNTFLTEIWGLPQLYTLCALPNKFTPLLVSSGHFVWEDPFVLFRMIHIIPISPGYFLFGKPLIQLSTIAYSNIQMSRLSRWQVNNNNNNNSRTTGRVVCRLLSSCNIANAGIAHPTTSNLEILWSWGRTNRLHSTGPQYSSMMSTQAQMATWVVTTKTPRDN